MLRHSKKKETSDANREDADKTRDEGKRKLDSGEDCSCWHDLNRIFTALGLGPTTKEGCTIDASGIINAVQGADESLHDEDAEMERWRIMYGGMEFWDDVNDWKPHNWELAVQARKLEMEFFRKMGVYKKIPRDVAKKMRCKVITTKWVDTK